MPRAPALFGSVLCIQLLEEVRARHEGWSVGGHDGEQCRWLVDTPKAYNYCNFCQCTRGRMQQQTITFIVAGVGIGGIILTHYLGKTKEEDRARREERRQEYRE